MTRVGGCLSLRFETYFMPSFVVFRMESLGLSLVFVYVRFPRYSESSSPVVSSLKGKQYGKSDSLIVSTVLHRTDFETLFWFRRTKLFLSRNPSLSVIF